MKLFRMTLTGIMLLGFTSVAIAQQKDSDNGGTPGRVSVDVIKLTGTVKAVDLDKKTVTVEGSKGRVETIDAKEARNLDQVKVGDKVTVTYTQALAVFVRKGDEPPSTSENQTVQLAVDVRVPAGDVRTFKVDPRVKNLGQVKKGDQVVLRYTESVALSVVKP